jgi:hypothetical protein
LLLNFRAIARLAFPKVPMQCAAASL